MLLSQAFELDVNTGRIPCSPVFLLLRWCSEQGVNTRRPVSVGDGGACIATQKTGIMRLFLSPPLISFLRKQTKIQWKNTETKAHNDYISRLGGRKRRVM